MSTYNPVWRKDGREIVFMDPRFYLPQPVEQPDSDVIHIRMGWAKE